MSAAPPFADGDAALRETRARASLSQQAASDPAVSTFVAASAGSGKTKLLTDRLLRLMLTGVPPGRILCLTFTRNAAAEMTLRLRARLAGWVAAEDMALDTALRDLGMAPDEALRDRARMLFAEVLDLPGGMRIDTIHAFCQSLLRRFPLEAGISPHFRLLDERDAQLSLREELEQVLASGPRLGPGRETSAIPDAIDLLAGQISADDLDRLIRDMDSARDRLGALLGEDVETLICAQRDALGVRRSEAEVWAAALSWPQEGAMREALQTIAERGTEAAQRNVLPLLDWLSLPAEARRPGWPLWRSGFLTNDGEPRKQRGLVAKALDTAVPTLWPTIEREQLRILALADEMAAAHLAELSAALLRIALPVLGAQAGRRQREAAMDYGDLIDRSNRLLTDPGAAWVLFKMDHGLDHILLDEVQDTAPSQWRIAGSLTAEFFAGSGARETSRTVFAVGDRKQSIYGFQGADLASFDQWRRLLAERVQAAPPAQWHDGALDVSFRSTEPVLQLVDAVFADPEARQGVVAPGEPPLRHHSARLGEAGRVEIWPLVPKAQTAAPEAWQIPDRNLAHRSGPEIMARSLANWIAEALRAGTPLASKGRALRAGDILILLRKRAPLAAPLVRALKAAGVPVAGLDRLTLIRQPAVQDLIALCDSLLLPEDDLSLACWLTSPLGGLDDDSLMHLAAGRPDGTTLYGALQSRAGERREWRLALDRFRSLLGQVDFATPHALLSRALGIQGGRARLFARLGPEAAEPVDELLNAALAYGAAHPPSLQGFLHWLRQSAAEAKREPEAAGDAVRVMTVHGAKGLQAPLVILADSGALPQADRGSLFWMPHAKGGPDLPIFCPRQALHSERSRAVRLTLQAAAREEHNRLLYVALTRAEDRLIICGWQADAKGNLPTWHALTQRGFLALGATPAPAALPEAADWPGEWLAYEAPQRLVPPPEKATATREMPSLPNWLKPTQGWRAEAPPPEAPRARPLAPSRPDNIAFGPVPSATSPVGATATGMPDRFARGTLVHTLLQHLPAVPPSAREDAALRFLSRPGGMPAEEAARVAAQCLALIADPALAQAFGPGSQAEAPLAGEIGGRIVNGVVDRLAITPEGITLLDFKTNRAPPKTVAQTPRLYLAQMAAYRDLLRAILPGQPVRCLLVWTETLAVTPLPDPLLDAHAPGATPPPATSARD